MIIFLRAVLFPIAFCINMVSSVYLYRLLGLLAEQRQNRKWLLLISNAFLFSLPVYNTDFVNVLGLLAGFSLLIFVCTKGDFMNRIAVIMIFYPLILGLNYIFINNPVAMYKRNYLYLHYAGIFGISARDFLLCLAAEVFLDALKAAVWFLLYYGFQKRLKEIKKYMSSQIWSITAVICTVSFISMITVILYPSVDVNMLRVSENIHELQYVLGDYSGTYIIVISAMISVLGILYLLQPVIENVKNKKKLEIESLKEEYYRSLDEQQESVRRMRHDMNNHFEAIRGCLEQGDTQGAREYLEQFGSSLPRGGGKQFCSDRALNAVLNNRWEKLCALQADVHFNLEVERVLELTSLDLCTIFSNALDNAVEAVKKIPQPDKRKVTLQARASKKYFSLRITNSKHNKIETESGKILTDKKEYGHGYGIDNIREIIEQYGGSMEVSYTEDEFVLFAYLRLE